jgi:formylglycine-generating enzyme required for sulfatase activity
MPAIASSAVWKLAAREADITVVLPGLVRMFFRRIPPGSFQMGARGEYADEEPLHRVFITREFFLGTFVVTQEQYRAVARKCDALNGRAEPSHFKGPRHPVGGVDWNEATAFCEWLTRSGLLPAGFLACLPTEAQWEYACRAGSETEYYNGDGEAALAEVGWYDENSVNETHPVDEKRELQPFGLFGMHGNVWEWCRDGWDADAYKKRVDGVAEPLESPEAGYRLRVQRGGSWVYSAWDCRSANRHGGGAVLRFGNVGFRVCLVPGSSKTGKEKSSRAKPATTAGVRGTSTEAKGAGGAGVDLAKEKMPRAAGGKILREKQYPQSAI